MTPANRILDSWRSLASESSWDLDALDEASPHVLALIQSSLDRGIPEEEVLDEIVSDFGHPEGLAREFRRAHASPTSLIMNALQPQNLVAASVGAAFVLAVALLLPTPAPRYQLAESNGITLRLDSRSGDVCAVLILAAGKRETQCETADGAPLAIATTLAGYELDFAGNLVKRQPQVLEAGMQWEGR